MSSDIGGILVGAVGLAVLDAVISRPKAVSNVGGVLANAGKAVNWFLSPAIPAFNATTVSAAQAQQNAIAQQQKTANQPSTGAGGVGTGNTPGGLVPAADVTPALSATGTQTLV